jgi:NTP pyrophosphatase (non-canonical NTP hydrolase)
MTEEMREFRLQLSQVDGMATELAELTRDVEDFKDDSLIDELEDILYQLETVITNIQESEEWI